jgi:hypothetical protein
MYLHLHSLQNGVIRSNCLDSLDRTGSSQQSLFVAAVIALLRASHIFLNPDDTQVRLLPEVFFISGCISY